MKSVHRKGVDYVLKVVFPQQLGIGVSSGVELKNVTAWIWSEERLASGRDEALAKDDRINAHNTFDNKSQRENRQRSMSRRKLSSPACPIPKPGCTRMI
jgi:hypothetical protein